MGLVPTNWPSSLPTALSVCSPITVSEKAHSTTNRCLSMSAWGEEKIRTKLKNVGQLTLFTKISPESKRETSPVEERMRNKSRLVWILVSALPLVNYFDFHPPGSTHNINIVHRVKRKIPLRKYKDRGEMWGCHSQCHDRQPRLGVGLVSRGNIIIRPPGASQSTYA